MNPLRLDPARPFQMVKFLSWGTLLLIVGFSLILSIFLAKYAKNIVLQKKQDFSLLLAENLNHQIYRRFTLPTVLGFGRVQLNREAQYKRLDKVVTSTIHSFHVLDLRIYDTSGLIAYSMDADKLDKLEMGGPQVQAAITERQPHFELISRLSNWKALFTLHPPARSFVLRTTYPLWSERQLGPLNDTKPLMGVLVFTQDITEDYEQVIHFQHLIIVTTCLSFLVLFFLLWVLIIRADRIFAERIREQKRLEDELHQNEKLASMGRMVASIAHEIRNPLGIIRSSAELLLKRARKEGDARASIVQALLDEAQRLACIVNEFLDYARPKTPNKADLALCLVVNHVLTFLEHDLKERGVEVIVDCPVSIEIQGDHDLLYRAIYNLVTNASQAMNGPGTIWITAFHADAQTVLEIRDTGPGFHMDLREKYLEPFYTTKDFGTGLGLSIVFTIMQSHGATLELDNHDQGGGLVRILFTQPPSPMPR